MEISLHGQSEAKWSWHICGIPNHDIVWRHVPMFKPSLTLCIWLQAMACSVILVVVVVFLVLTRSLRNVSWRLHSTWKWKEQHTCRYENVPSAHSTVWAGCVTVICWLATLYSYHTHPSRLFVNFVSFQDEIQIRNFCKEQHTSLFGLVQKILMMRNLFNFMYPSGY